MILNEAAPELKAVDLNCSEYYSMTDGLMRIREKDWLSFQSFAVTCVYAHPASFTSTKFDTLVFSFGKQAESTFLYQYERLME